MLQHTVELTSLLVRELGTCVVSEALRRDQRRHGRGQHCTARPITVGGIYHVFVSTARTRRAMGIASFVRVARALGLRRSVVLHSHVLCECIRASKRFVALGTGARKWFLTRMAAQMAQQGEARRLAFAFACTADPFARVARLVNADMNCVSGSCCLQL